jgi:1-acyl-sn-glycerol-3-phosphate acyltransferase
VTLPPADWWRTVFFLIPVIAVYTIVLGTVSLVSTLVDRRGHAAHRAARLWSRLIVSTTGVRIDLAGAPRPAEDESCIFVANHASIYDIPILFTVLPHQLRIMAKATLAYVPFIGWHLRRAGHVLVNRTNPGAGIYKRMRRMTEQGASLIVFPEGSRSDDGLVGPFKPGIFLLAIESGLPVVPISVIGSRVVMPRGRLMVRPARVRVILHPAIATAGLAKTEARALAERARGIVVSGVRQ